jgi:Flp pilus assembly protein TadD
MPKSSGSVTSLILFGAAGSLSILALLGWYFWSRSSSKSKGKKQLPPSAPSRPEPTPQKEEEENETDVVEDQKQDTSSKEVDRVQQSQQSGVVVEDEEDDDEDVVDEAALRTAYDDALRLAKKLLNGNSYARAADKFTEAIDLAPKIPSAAKDLVTLYNNRRYRNESLHYLSMYLSLHNTNAI